MNHPRYYSGRIEQPPATTAARSSLPNFHANLARRSRVCCAALLVGVAILNVSAAAESAPSGKDVSKGEGKRPPSKLMEIGVDAALERARSFYEAGRYDSCAKSFGEILALEAEVPEEISTSTIEQSRVYFAACLLATGDPKAADEQLRRALTANPLMASPDPVIFPDQVRDLFFKVKADFLDDIQRAQEAKLEQARVEAEKRAELVRQERLRVQRLEELAATESLVHYNRRWLAWVPFGVGQFQNGETAFGIVMLTGQTLALGTAVFAVSRELSYHSQAGGGRNVEDEDAFNEPIELLRPMGVYASAGFLFLATIGILEAHINFVPEVPIGTRPRKLPDHLVTPEVSVGSDSAFVGVKGRF